MTFDSLVFEWASYLGVVAFALSGLITGARKNMDLMGSFILAFLTATGGGLIRDTLLDRPITVFDDTIVLILIISSFLCGLLLIKSKKVEVENIKLFLISDSIGLVTFSLTGAMVGVNSGMNAFGIIVVSFLTATGGGIIRDVLAQRIPVVFTSGIYGSISVLIGLAIYLIPMASEHIQLYVFTIFAVALSLRLAAIRFDWSLPKVKLD